MLPLSSKKESLNLLYMNYEWYNNGIFNKRIYKNEKVPEGFSKGFLRLSKKRKLPQFIEYGRKYAERRRSQKETVIFRKLKIRQKLSQIDEMSKRGMKFEDIYDLVKVDEKYFELNRRLSYIINEKMLIAQVGLFPKFINTITDSLKELYSREPALQNRKSYEDYIYGAIKELVIMP